MQRLRLWLGGQLHAARLVTRGEDSPETIERRMKNASGEMARAGDRFHPVSYYRENWVEDRIIKRTKAD